MVTAVVLTKNEENNIARCLDSVSWCDEIIVIDDNSSDRTRDIARKFNAKVILNTLKDFSSQRNLGLSKAVNKWVFFVDADEYVSDALRHEITTTVAKNTTVTGYYLKREDILWGRVMNHGELGDITLIRLAKKDAGIWTGKVHEIWNINGITEKLTNPLTHYPHQSIYDFLSEINYYSDMRANELYEQKTPSSFLSIIVYPYAKFLYNYLLKKGFLDGIQGIIVALMMSLHSFLVRGKLWQLNQSKSG